MRVQLSTRTVQDPTRENKKEGERGMEDVYLHAMEMSLSVHGQHQHQHLPQQKRQHDIQM